MSETPPSTPVADAPICPTCEPENPAARYRDTCLGHRIEDSLPAHYFDCDRFQTYNYGLRSGDCDCTATADMRALLAERQSAPSAPEAHDA